MIKNALVTLLVIIILFFLYFGNMRKGKDIQIRLNDLESKTETLESQNSDLEDRIGNG